jgi:hypothetical protein
MAVRRAFVIRSPHIRGDEVRVFQADLNHRFKRWKIGKRIPEDEDYGTTTRDAAREVCTGLGIRHEVAMKKGVTPPLRAKIRRPQKRTVAEIERAKGKGAKEFRAALRRKFAASAAGLQMVDGVQVAAWMAPSLRWARAHGWSGRVVSGFRTCEHQKAVAQRYAAEHGMTVAEAYPNGPCASNHVGQAHPRGAVDVTEPEELARVLRDNPHQPPLVWGGPVIDDRVHFSATGH